MKPRTQTPLGHPKGFTVRLSNRDLETFKSLAKKQKQDSVNQLFAQMVGQVIAMCTGAFDIPAESLLVNLAPSSKKEWNRMATATCDVRRTLPNTETNPIRITFPGTERQDLRSLAQRLRWAEGQLILEALHAFCQLAAATEPIVELPDVIDLSRGRIFYSKETGGTTSDCEKLTDPDSMGKVLGTLNLALRLISAPNLAQPDKPAKKMTTSLNLV